MASPIAPFPATSIRSAPISHAAPAMMSMRATRKTHAVFLHNMERLKKKFETAKQYLPKSVSRT